MPFDAWEAAERLEGGWKLTIQKGTFPAEIATHHCHSQKQDDQKLTAKEPHLVWQSMSWADHRSWLHMISLLLWRRTRTLTCQKRLCEKRLESFEDESWIIISGPKSHMCMRANLTLWGLECSSASSRQNLHFQHLFLTGDTWPQ